MRARLIAGDAFGASSPLVTASDTLYADVSLAAGARASRSSPAWTSAPSTRSPGTVEIGGDAFEAGSTRRVPPRGADRRPCAERRALHAVRRSADGGPRYLWWNFVSSRPRAHRAGEGGGGRRGGFDTVPGDESEFIPLPEYGRAVQRAEGRGALPVADPPSSRAATAARPHTADAGPRPAASVRRSEDGVTRAFLSAGEREPLRAEPAQGRRRAPDRAASPPATARRRTPSGSCRATGRCGRRARAGRSPRRTRRGRARCWSAAAAANVDLAREERRHRLAARQEPEPRFERVAECRASRSGGGRSCRSSRSG